MYAYSQVLRELGSQGHKIEDAPYVSNWQLESLVKIVYSGL